MEAQALRSIRRALVSHRSQVASLVVLAWSIDYTITLAVVHNTGAELYGVLTAALATAAAVANLGLLRSPQVRLVATAVVLVVWTIVAFGGIAGTIAHLVGPLPGHGPIDLRPRPIAAPLVFTLLGAVGAAALSLGQRARMRTASTFDKE